MTTDSHDSLCLKLNRRQWHRDHVGRYSQDTDLYQRGQPASAERGVENRSPRAKATMASAAHDMHFMEISNKKLLNILGIYVCQ